MSRGMKFSKGQDSHKEIDYDVLHEDMDRHFDAGEELKGIGEKFVSDKEKLEDAIDRIQNSKLSLGEKAEMLAELNNTIEALKKQFDKDVAAVQAKVHGEIDELIDEVEQGVTELSEQANSLKEVSLDAASTDTSAAADAADKRKQEFEALQRESVQKLQLQMDSAARQQREMFRRRISGR